MPKVMAEYIWIDGQKPTAKLRSKMKVLDGEVRSPSELPDWSFDGSSTYQAEGKKSDLMLRPVRFIPNPLRPGTPDILVLCEVMNPDGSPHWSNTRAPLRMVAEKYASEETWFGMEQEYTLFEGNRPLGWPDKGFPAPQGGYYCGVGSDEVFGRELVESHAEACLRAGIKLGGTNAEVMPAQWEFQIGPLAALEMGDELWLARWLLYRMGEDMGISATLHPKPVKGDWNGDGLPHQRQHEGDARGGWHQGHRGGDGEAARAPRRAHRGVRRAQRGAPDGPARDGADHRVPLRRERPWLVHPHPAGDGERWQGLLRGSSSGGELRPVRGDSHHSRDDLQLRSALEVPTDSLG